METQKKSNIRVLKITSKDALNKAEIDNRVSKDVDFMPWAIGTSYAEIAENIIIDKNGSWSTPLHLVITYHTPNIEANELNRQVKEFLEEYSKDIPLDILSITSHMLGTKLVSKALIRPYSGLVDFGALFDKLGESVYEEEKQVDITAGSLVIPDEIKNFKYSKEEIDKHNTIKRQQDNIFDHCSEEKPFLNSIDKYEPRNLPRPEEKLDLIYDLKTSDMKVSTIAPYDDFIDVFRDIMRYVNGIEYYSYIKVIKGDSPKEQFMDHLETYIKQSYVSTKRLYQEDLPIMMEKLERSLFQFYVLQDLIDDPNVTDIKVTAPDAIRARVKGKAYMSNITFIDKADYLRFVEALAIKNGISQNVPSQTFTDDSDKNFIIRFSLSAAYANSVEWPYLHIRKIDRKKMLSKELIEAGMMDEKIRDYLLDCGKEGGSRGVVFAGPPGSGKTVCLNWFLEEAYEQEAEILVIQENDELFCNRKGVMFQHVVNYSGWNDEMPVSLEELGKIALVAGANVFIIGEAKGAEICSAITLSNSGCRTAITIHSPSSTETIDKMADLAMRGYAQDIDQAKRMLRSFQTIVYLEKFKIREISEIIGYDEEKHDMIYRYIYRDPNWVKK